MRKVIIILILAISTMALIATAQADAPAVPTDIIVAPLSATSVNISWSASAGAAGYEIYRNSTSTPIATTSLLNFSDTNLAPQTVYTYYLTAFDASSTKSLFSNGVSTTTLSDTAKPTPPANLTAVLSPITQANLNWIVSTDNVAVVGYKIYRNSVMIATTTNNYFSNSGLVASTTYTYAVSAFDAAGNESDKSATATATTLITNPISTSSNVKIAITNGKEIGKVINLRSNQIVKIAVYSDNNFKARNIKNNTVVFGGAKPTGWILRDVNRDGKLDRIYSFRTRQMKDLANGDTIAKFAAQTKAGQNLYAELAVKVINSPKKNHEDHKEKTQEKIEKIEKEIEKTKEKSSEKIEKIKENEEKKIENLHAKIEKTDANRTETAEEVRTNSVRQEENSNNKNKKSEKETDKTEKNKMNGNKNKRNSD